MQRHLYEHFQLPGHRYFTRYVMLLSLIRPILGHPLSVKIIAFIPLRQNHLWDLLLKVVTELLSSIVIVQLFLFLDLYGLFQDYSRFIWIIATFILSFETVLVFFRLLRWRFLLAVVNDVISVTIAMDSFLLEVRNSLLIIIIIFVAC